MKKPSKLKKPIFFIDKSNFVKRLNVDGTVDDFIEYDKYSDLRNRENHVSFKLQNTENELEKLKKYHEELSLCHSNLKSLLHDVKSLSDPIIRKLFPLADDETKIKINEYIKFAHNSGGFNLLNYKSINSSNEQKEKE